MNHRFLRNTLGSKEKAEQIAERAKKFVPAYKYFLKQHRVKPGEEFEKLPQMDKETYILAYPLKELLADDHQGGYTISCSSGSSGGKSYWPQISSTNCSLPARLRMFLESNFAVHQRKTLAIMGCSLGGWNASQDFDWALKNIAVSTPYPFYLCSVGKNLDEIIELSCQMTSWVEQIILFLAPSAISLLHLKASQLKQSLPWAKLRYVVTGEPFPESVRVGLQRRAEVEENAPFMFSFYGSADTGLLGTESQASIALRKLLYYNPDLANDLGIEAPIPHFFHFSSADTFLEAVDGHLCVTRWQGILLVRYILYDRVSLYRWKELKQTILTSKSLESQDEPWVKIIAAASELLPDLLAVTGRADNCLILGGDKFTEYMLDEAVKCEQLQDILTGIYRAQVVYEKDRQYLKFELEIRECVCVDQTISDQVYKYLLANLLKVNKGFQQEWETIYSSWNEASSSIMKIDFLVYPSLSRIIENEIKNRTIINKIKS